MSTVRITRINPWSLFKISFLVSWITALPFVAFTAFLILRSITGLVAWLGGLVYQVRLPLLGNLGFDINVLELLKLQDFYTRLQGWAVLGILPTLILIGLAATLIALFWGCVAALSGWVFNLLSRAAGGIEVTLTKQEISE